MALECGCNGPIVYVEYERSHNTPRWAWFDGVSEIRCESCGARYGRWTGRKIQDGEYEPRYGGGTVATNA